MTSVFERQAGRLDTARKHHRILSLNQSDVIDIGVLVEVRVPGERGYPMEDCVRRFASLRHIMFAYDQRQGINGPAEGAMCC